MRNRRTHFRDQLNLQNRCSYRRLLRLESLEPRSLMAVDCLPVGDTSRFGEGEGAEALLGKGPLFPAELVSIGSAGGASFGQVVSPSVPLNSTFFLHSRPTATKTIYLDFNGFTARGTSWNRQYNNNQPIVSRAYDPDGDGPGFSNNELASIQRIWQRVAADFSPFDVNVTTQDPGEANLVNTGSGDVRWGIRAVMTADNFVDPNFGGFAYIGSFNWGYESAGATDTPAYVFNPGDIGVAATISHEVGHSLGLSHDGTNANNPIQPSAEYYNGHGTGENAWGPIMGSGFFRNVSTWDNGTYLGTSNSGPTANFGDGPSDLQIITTENGFGFVPDDAGNTIQTAVLLTGTSIPGGKQSLSALGTISQSTDVDFFRFQAGNGPIDIVIDPYVTQTWVNDGQSGFSQSIEDSFFDGQNWSQNQGANLDVEATLFNAAGEVIAISNPIGLRASFSNLVLPTGTYFIRVDGVGFGDPTANPPTGYSDYASIGQFRISGTISSSIELNIPTTNPDYVENSSPVPIAPGATFVSFNVATFTGGQITAAFASGTQTGDRLALQSTGSAAGQVSVSNSAVSYGGVEVGTLTSGGSSLTVTLNSAATTESMGAIVSALTFEHITDSPTSAVRSVMISFDNGENGASNQAIVRVSVSPTNDAPTLLATSLASVLEDSVNPPGATVAAIASAAFRDVDLNASLSGIVITGNSVPLSQGLWQFGFDGRNWTDVGAVSPSQALVLSTTAYLRFRPVPNFNGATSPLLIRAIDETYTGFFSDAASSAFVNVEGTSGTGAISLQDSSLTTTITPVNDAPTTVVGQQEFVSPEDQLLSIVFSTTWFADIDNPTLSYSLTLAGEQPIPSWLTFNSSTRTLEGVGTLSFVLKATDNGNLSTTLPVRLTITNVNDAPVGLFLSNNVVTESQPGAFIGILSASDPDNGDEISWVISDDRFEVRENRLFLKPNQIVDFEEGAIVFLPVQAIDSGTPPLSYEEVLELVVVDVNEFAPELQATSFSILENSATLDFGFLSAPDKDTANLVRYRFVGTPPTGFILNAATGDLSLAPGTVLDFERAASYQFFVEALDNGVPQQSTTASITVRVVDVNEFDPAITTSSVSVIETQAINRVFGQVVATDGDTSNSVRYTILGSAGPFVINDRTGELMLTQVNALDFETAPTRTLRIQATDNGTPARSSVREITINITDGNDAPTGASVSRSLLSNVSEQSLGRIVVLDQDIQSYSLVSLDNRFTIVDGELVMLPGRNFTDNDPAVIPVFVQATETPAPGSSYGLTVNVNRIANPRPWQNRLNTLDVDRSGAVNALDVLAILNVFSVQGANGLPIPRPASQLNLPDYDVDGDGSLNPLDALVIINFINRGGSGEGEGVADSELTPAETMDSDVWLAAYRQIEEEQLLRRRRG
jgi:hypothetical protein